MAGVEVRGLDELMRGLGNLSSEQIPRVLAKTLSAVAVIAKDNTIDEMKRVFDRPTPFTLNALKTVNATVSTPRSLVTLKDNMRLNPEQHYLNPQVTGGERWFKKFEARLYKKGILPRHYMTVPASGADLDAYGNMSRAQIIQMLAFFDAFPEAGYRSNMGDAGRARLARGTRRRQGFAYFAIHPNVGSNLAPGIYKRLTSNFGSPITMVLRYVRHVNYRPKLDLGKIAEETYERNFDRLFTENFIDAVNTAIPR